MTTRVHVCQSLLGHMKVASESLKATSKVHHVWLNVSLEPISRNHHYPGGESARLAPQQSTSRCDARLDSGANGTSEGKSLCHGAKLRMRGCILPSELRKLFKWIIWFWKLCGHEMCLPKLAEQRVWIWTQKRYIILLWEWNLNISSELAQVVIFYRKQLNVIILITFLNERRIIDVCTLTPDRIISVIILIPYQYHAQSL